MGLFKKCPVCGGELKEKKVEKFLPGGVHTAVLKVKAEVCLHCGEKLYPPETVKKFELVRKKLKKGDLSDFEVMGKSVRAV